MHSEVADVVVQRLSTSTTGHLVVGVDGTDGAGKTMFADAPAELVHARLGRPGVTRVSLDDFHRPRELHYRRGRNSAEGFSRDSYDCEAVVSRVLGPVAVSGGNPVAIVPGSRDLVTDKQVTPDAVRLSAASVVIVDGVFLHRPELTPFFGLTLFLDVPFAETARRMAQRDGSNPDPEHESMRRYVDGQRLYFTEVRPWEKADIVIDNSDVENPRMIR